jgi:hypothetical protein
MNYQDEQTRLAALDRDLAEFDRIDAFHRREGHFETAHDSSFHSSHVPEIAQMRAERDALRSVMGESPGSGSGSA